MGDVEHDSLRYLNNSDMLAIADYLKPVSSTSARVEGLHTPLNEHAGYKLYESNCRVCHETGVVGAPEIDNRKYAKSCVTRYARNSIESPSKAMAPCRRKVDAVSVLRHVLKPRWTI